MLVILWWPQCTEQIHLYETAAYKNEKISLKQVVRITSFDSTISWPHKLGILQMILRKYWVLL